MFKGLKRLACVSSPGRPCPPKPKSEMNSIRELVHKVDPTWPKPTKFLAKGKNGQVYTTNDPKILLKIVLGNKPEEFKALAKLQKARYANRPIVPRFEKGWGRVIKIANLNQNIKNALNQKIFNSNNSHLTMFLMGRVGNANSMTLDEYVKKFRNSANVMEVQRILARIGQEMWHKGVGHGNIHGGNIIVSATPDGRIKGLWVIDFGRTTFFPVGSTHTRALQKLPNSNSFNSWGEITRKNIFPGRSPESVERALARHRVKGYWGANYVIKRPNVGVLKAAHGVSANEKNAARLRALVARVARTLPRTSPRRAKSLSPRKNSTK